MIESFGHDEQLDLGSKVEITVKVDSQVSGSRWIMVQLFGKEMLEEEYIEPA